MKKIIGLIIFCMSLILVILFVRDIYDFEYVYENFLASQSNPTFFSKRIELFYIYGLFIFICSLICCYCYILYIIKKKKAYFRYIIICFFVEIVIILYQTISVIIQIYQ